MMKTKPKNQQGFTLIELMIVVAIIGILTSLALPSFKTFQGKARQAEARTNLSQIYVLEEAYFVDANTYVEFARTFDVYGYAATGSYDCDATGITRRELGFRISSCTGSPHSGAPRYGYYVSPITNSQEFQANATSDGNIGPTADNLVMPGCSRPDVATIDQTKTFTRVSDSVKSCDGSGYQ